MHYRLIYHHSFDVCRGFGVGEARHQQNACWGGLWSCSSQARLVGKKTQQILEKGEFPLLKNGKKDLHKWENTEKNTQKIPQNAPKRGKT